MRDNVGDGVRGLRATASQELLDLVQFAFKIRFTNEPIDLGGSSNLNLLVADSSRQYVLRVYRPYVTAERLDAINHVREELSHSDIPCGELVTTADRQLWISFDGRLVELEHYVEHDSEMNTWPSLRVGLSLLAQIHTILQDIIVNESGRKPRFANYIESTQTLRRTFLGTQRIRGWNPSPLELKLADDAEELAHRVSRAESSLPEKLPKQLVHGDFWDNNVCLRDGKVVLVADFDFMGERHRIDDIALTLYFTCMEFFQASVSDDQLEQLRKLLDAYDLGSAKPLTLTERAALPLAIARQPLWSIGGWVAMLDDEETARIHAVNTDPQVKWALRLMDEVERWQDVFVSSST
jgi:Ser/Thr protein kinase RdoA (MazF antagonist)